MKRILTVLSTVVLAAAVLCSCGKKDDSGKNLRIVAYYPSFSGSEFFEPWWDQITHMNLSFCKINADGSINDAAVRRSFSDLAQL